MELDFHMHAERTPNPNSLKWVLGQPVMEGGASVHFEQAPAPEVSPLGARLFGVRGIVFAGFRDGVVELYLQGACSGCPSSTATLKFGIEQRLREDIPEVLEVVAL